MRTVAPTWYADRIRTCGPFLQAVMAHADWIIDLGPGAGHNEGRIVFEGISSALVAARSALTGEHLAAYVGD